MYTYSEITLNGNYPDQWFLRDYILDNNPKPVPIWFFGQGVHITTKTLSMKIAEGTTQRLDWHDGEFSVPIISYPVWESIGPMIKDDVQAIPCDVEGVEEKFILLNLLNKIDCIDEQKSKIVYIPEREKQESIARGDSYIRKYRDVSNLTIDPARVGDHKLFWTKHWPAQIIRNDVRDAFLAAGFKGPSFIPV